MCLQCRDFAICEIATFQLNKNDSCADTLFGHIHCNRVHVKLNVSEMLRFRKIFDISSSVSAGESCLFPSQQLSQVCFQRVYAHASYCSTEMSRFRNLRNRDI